MAGVGSVPVAIPYGDSSLYERLNSSTVTEQWIATDDRLDNKHMAVVDVVNGERFFINKDAKEQIYRSAMVRLKRGIKENAPACDGCDQVKVDHAEEKDVVRDRVAFRLKASCKINPGAAGMFCPMRRSVETAASTGVSPSAWRSQYVNSPIGVTAAAPMYANGSAWSPPPPNKDVPQTHADAW